jgi:hypothetical protein
MRDGVRDDALAGTATTSTGRLTDRPQNVVRTIRVGRRVSARVFNEPPSRGNCPGSSSIASRVAPRNSAQYPVDGAGYWGAGASDEMARNVDWRDRAGG